MSAHVVDRAHIAYMVEAGLRLGVRHHLSWTAPKGAVGESDLPPPTTETDRRFAADPILGDYRRRHRELRADTADRVGKMLWEENHRSVSYRYNEAQLCPVYGPHVVRYMPPPLNPVAILKVIDCYEYQSCECPDWRDTEAYAFCESLRRDAIAALPGYEDAPWDITEPSEAPA